MNKTILTLAAALGLVTQVQSQQAPPVPTPPPFAKQQLMSLTWNPNPEPNVSHYQVWWSTNGSAWTSPYTNVTDTSWEIPHYVVGLNSFFVTAVSQNGLVSDPSESVSTNRAPTPSKVLNLNILVSTNLTTTNSQVFWSLQIEVQDP